MTGRPSDSKGRPGGLRTPRDDQAAYIFASARAPLELGSSTPYGNPQDAVGRRIRPASLVVATLCVAAGSPFRGSGAAEVGGLAPLTLDDANKAAQKLRFGDSNGPARHSHAVGARGEIEKMVILS
jgi:hypothetical protein